MKTHSLVFDIAHLGGPGDMGETWGDTITVSSAHDFVGSPWEEPIEAFRQFIQKQCVGCVVILRHNWKPLSEILGNTGYDVLYKCTHCGSVHTESVDDIDSYLPVGPCPGHKETQE